MGIFYDITENDDLYFEGSLCKMQPKQYVPYLPAFFVYVATDSWEMPNFETNFQVVAHGLMQMPFFLIINLYVASCARLYFLK